MGSYKCSSCNALVLNGTLHGCYDVTNRVQPNHANLCPNPPAPGNDEFNYPSQGAAAAILTYGSGPSGADFTANQVDPFVAGVPSQTAPLGRFPQPAGAGPSAGLQYEPVPSETQAEASAVAYNGKPKNVSVAYQSESGSTGQLALGTVGTVVITGTGGQFSCVGSSLAVGMQLVISGTFGGTGSITGYVNPTTYIISATNGTSTFTLTTPAGAPVVTTAGTPTGLTYTLSQPQPQGGMF